MNPVFRELQSLATEQRLPQSMDVDGMGVRAILELMNDQDAGVAAAVRAAIPQIEQVVVSAERSFRAGGRLLYFGAGTSGRLGVVDASECPPTFGTPPEMVQARIAGGPPAIYRAQEGAEDDAAQGAAEVAELEVGAADTVVGIAASGRTPYVLGALGEAQRRGAYTALLTTAGAEPARNRGCVPGVVISPEVGPEVVTGSTRLKSGTAQKLVLNMITTAAMIRLGKVYTNVMVDLQATNEKLVQRARRTVMEVTGADYHTADRVLVECDGHVKTAIVMLLGNVDAARARHALARADGFVRTALEQLQHI